MCFRAVRTLRIVSPFATMGLVGQSRSSCSCAERLTGLLEGWTSVLRRRLGEDPASPGTVSVLLHAGCSRSCSVQALLRMRASCLPSPRWVVRSMPALPPLLLGDESVAPGVATSLRAASTVFLTSERIVAPSRPPAFIAPSIRRVYFPPLSLWDQYSSRLPADPLAAVEVFDALVDDGMPVLAALTSSVELAR